MGQAHLSISSCQACHSAEGVIFQEGPAKGWEAGGIGTHPHPPGTR